jgi:hypothetical protein
MVAVLIKRDLILSTISWSNGHRSPNEPAPSWSNLSRTTQIQRPAPISPIRRKVRRRQLPYGGAITGARPPADPSANPQIQGSVDGAEMKVSHTEAFSPSVVTRKRLSTRYGGTAATVACLQEIPFPSPTDLASGDHGYPPHGMVKHPGDCRDPSACTDEDPQQRHQRHPILAHNDFPQWGQGTPRRDPTKLPARPEDATTRSKQDWLRRQLGALLTSLFGTDTVTPGSPSCARQWWWWLPILSVSTWWRHGSYTQDRVRFWEEVGQWSARWARSVSEWPAGKTSLTARPRRSASPARDLKLTTWAWITSHMVAPPRVVSD